MKQHLRPIRSYVLRQGRITDSQQHALTALWSQYGLDVPLEEKPYDWNRIFGRKAPLVLEIGFGMGDSLIELAKMHPDKDFIGIEVHQPGVGHCLKEAQKWGLTNIRIFCVDAHSVLAKCILDESLDKILLLFPDPWPKKKHHKRRIVQPDFVHVLSKKLKEGGLLHLATDWQPYADHMFYVLEASPLLAKHCLFEQQHEQRIQTKFERRGVNLGHTIVDLVYHRSSPTLLI